MASSPPDISGLPSFAFGNSPELADHIAALVVAGRKTLTGWPVEEGDKATVPGLVEVVLCSKGNPVCTIETTSLVKSSFNAISANDAAAYGEGDLSLAWWRWALGRYYKAQGVFRGDMSLYLQSFRLRDVLNAEFAATAPGIVAAAIAQARKDGFDGDADA